ncbi:MAG: hypothetical protein R3B13_13480 [Polyangiaceae bacterium]
MASPLIRCIALAAMTLGCGQVELDQTGRECPCGEDFKCDAICKVCVPRSAALGAACPEKADACVPKVTFTDFKVDWVTPNAIRWRWTPDGDATSLTQDFQSYSLVLTSKGKTLVYDVSTNPELGLAVLPNSGVDLTNGSITGDLEAGMTYSATLTARDTAGCEFAASNTAPTTPTPTSQSPIEIFGESAFGGTIVDGTVVTTGCHLGQQCLRTDTCTLDPDAGKAACTKNLRVTGVDIGTGALTQGAFLQAYLEFYARTDTSAPSYYSTVFFEVGPEFYRFEGFTFPASTGYRRVQIPLRVLSSAQGLLDFATLQSLHVSQFNFGTHVAEGAHTWVDEVYIRW